MASSIAVVEKPLSISSSLTSRVNSGMLSSPGECRGRVADVPGSLLWANAPGWFSGLPAESARQSSR